jgi:hypothetical protein
MDSNPHVFAVSAADLREYAKEAGMEF